MTQQYVLRVAASRYIEVGVTLYSPFGYRKSVQRRLCIENIYETRDGLTRSPMTPPGLASFSPAVHLHFLCELCCEVMQYALASLSKEITKDRGAYAPPPGVYREARKRARKLRGDGKIRRSGRIAAVSSSSPRLRVILIALDQITLPAYTRVFVVNF